MHAQVTGNLLEIQKQIPLTQGTVGQTLSTSFSEDWAGLTVTAVFSAGPLARDVLLSGSELPIPWELLAEPHHELTLNFHGANAAGTLVRRSNIASLGKILPSRSPSGTAPEAPTPSRADQIQLLAEQALDVAEATRDMSVEAETLAAGTAAAVTKTVDPSTGAVTLLFGIPRGADGTDSHFSLSPYTSEPAALGTASPGSSGDYARGDHVHPRPSYTAADVGAIAAPSSPTSGQFLVFNGSAWTAMTLATWQGGSY